MSRQRSARSAALGLTVRRIPTTIPSRGGGPLRRRLVVGLLVLASLVLISLSFRSDESGPLSGVQSAGATVLRPFAVGFERVAQPFRDAYGWADSLLTARSEAERLREENRHLRSARSRTRSPCRRTSTSARCSTTSTARGSRRTSTRSSAEVVGRPDGAFTQAIVIAAGSRTACGSTTRSSPPTAWSASSPA